MKTFQEFLEARMEIQGQTFLIDPSARELEIFIRKIHAGQRLPDFDVRGLANQETCYWFNAFYFTHDFAARTLKLDYKTCSRMNAYVNRYNEIVVDYPEAAAHLPGIVKLNLDDEGILPSFIS